MGRWMDGWRECNVSHFKVFSVTRDVLRVTNVRIDLTAINEIVRFNLFTGLRERTHGEILCKFKFDDLSKKN